MTDYFKNWNLEKLPDDYVMSDDEYTLRQMVWESHGGLTHHFLYGDDGELNCNTCHIDFKRLTVMSIFDALGEQAMARMVEYLKRKGE